MPHSILGVDIGAQSIRVAVLSAGFRQLELVDLYERPLAAGPESDLIRAGRALRELVREQGLGEATLYAALPGDQISVRLLRLPFAESRKIDQVLAFEMESQILWEVEEVVMDHIVAESSAHGGAKVLAAAARIEPVRTFLAAMDESGMEPRALLAAPLVYGALAERVRDPALVCAFLDLGETQTQLCVARGGSVLLGRTLPWGLANARSQADDASEGSFGGLLRELRQTLALVAAEFGISVGEMFLCGGSAAVAGLGEYLQDELGISASMLDLGSSQTFEPIPGAPEPPASMALALAVGLAGATGRREIDFRRGDLAYKADYSFLRAKAVYFLACLLAVLGAASLSAMTAHWQLRREKVRLSAALGQASMELLGTSETDPEVVSAKIKQGIKMDELPVPAASAYDLLVQISSQIPSGQKIKLDITELEIKPKKSFLKGTVDSASAVDAIKEGLATIECFRSKKEDLIQKGAITNLPGQQDLKQFTLTIASKCP